RLLGTGCGAPRRRDTDRVDRRRGRQMDRAAERHRPGSRGGRAGELRERVTLSAHNCHHWSQRRQLPSFTPWVGGGLGWVRPGECDADFVPLYPPVPIRPEQPPDGDLVVLASASAADAFAALDIDLPSVSIGPETTRAAESAGLDVVAEAEQHDLDGLVAAVE